MGVWVMRAPVALPRVIELRPAIASRAVVAGSESARLDVVAFQQPGDAVGGDRLLQPAPLDPRPVLERMQLLHQLGAGDLVLERRPSSSSKTLRQSRSSISAGSSSNSSASASSMAAVLAASGHAPPAMSAIASSGRQPSISRSLRLVRHLRIGFGKRGGVFDGEARRLPSERRQVIDAAAVEAGLRLAGSLRRSRGR